MKVKKITTDYDLIASFQDQDNPFARDAFITFYNRYSSFIYDCCYSFVRTSPNVNDISAESEDLSSIVIIKIINTSTFKPKTDIEPDNIVFHIRAWIYRIIEFTFNDEFIKKPERRPKLIRFESETQDNVEFNYLQSKDKAPRQLSEENKKKYELIEKAVSRVKMSNMEAAVLGVYMESGWFDERDNWNIPPERMSELTEKYDVQRNSIIQCRIRLMKKIKAQL